MEFAIALSVTDRDIDRLAELLSEAATLEIMPRFRNVSPDDVRLKSSVADVVTAADECAERLIRQRLRAMFPTALIVGEELHEEDTSGLRDLPEADLAFVIDPLDGTANFASGLPLFGVILAVVVRGQTIAGLIYNPIGQEWIIGVRGSGSFLRGSDGPQKKLQVASPKPLSHMIGGVSWEYVDEPLRSRIAMNHAKALAPLNYRCAAHEYRLLASGFGHFALYNKLMPWDHLAGVLVHREAGGYAARFDGTPYGPGIVDGGLLLAPDRESWQELRRELWADPND
ncbi:inositol monophosphatase family protein [Yinghuangia aomiensis]